MLRRGLGRPALPFFAIRKFRSSASLQPEMRGRSKYGRWRNYLALCVVVLAVIGCGGTPEDQSGSVAAARSWLAHLRQGEWTAACAMLAEPPRGCARVYRRDFEGSRVKLLRTGAYLNGNESNDNKTRFALEATRGRPSQVVYFAVAREESSDWQIKPLVQVASPRYMKAR